jgi:hypothetical protein
MKKITDFSKISCFLFFFICLNTSNAIGQHGRDFSGINFQGADVKFPNPISIDNYNNQSSFVIYPDYHLTQKWVKAGAYFSYNGNRVRAESVQISVYLPKNGNKWGYREHNESNVGEPDWSGWWHEPWENGFFCYTVKAYYNGYWYETVFEVRPNFVLKLADYAKQAAIIYFESQSGSGGR